MAQLYAQAPVTHFGPLSRPARPAVGLFFSPVAAVVTPLMLQSLAMSNEKDSSSPRNNGSDLSKQDIFLQVLDEKRAFAQLSLLLYVSAPHDMELRAANAQINQS